MEKKLCMGCMENKGSARVCPNCGYVENTPSLPSYIYPGTIIHERYLVGKLLNANGQGATYIAYDTAVSCKVLLNEYMPEGLCVRVKGRPTISVNYNNLAQYKALMAEYTELNKTLAKMRSLSSHLSPTLDLFAENNTTYAVYEYIEGVRLVDYLKENAGELSWSEVSAMFPPLFTTLSLVHNAGVIHRGISPETIYVTDKGELKLTDFCISAVRTANTELKNEIFGGYAAPEQYCAASRQGTWTDVYGICSVLYRILTGSKPESANVRIERDNLYTPQELNPNIPKHVSDVIMHGMHIDGDSRIKTITELVTLLFDQPTMGIGQTQTITISRNGVYENPSYPSEENYQDYNNNDNYYDNQQYNNQQYNNQYNDDYNNQYNDQYNDEYGDYEDYSDYDDYDDDSGIEESSVSTFDKIKIPIIIGILLIAIILVIVVILMKLFTNDTPERLHSSYIESSSVSDNIVDMTEETVPEETEKETKAEGKMPNLVGEEYEEIKSKIEDKYKIKIDADFEYNSDHKEGIIFWQEVKKGEKIKEGDKIKIKVSKGSQKVKVPDYEGYTLDEYTDLLYELGIEYSEVSEIDYDYEDGYVTGVSPGVGEKINITEDEVITVYYASNPVQTEPPTERPTEAPTEKPTEAPTEAPTEPPTEAPTEPPTEAPTVPDVIIE